ncbi:hypothetical protein ACQR0V_25305 [Bradyrhizobium sp. HKCCYLS2058]|uniref:hypothetical protein n=1 Tax=unclassified Bradyrhizobium TaxID=2631580 RepID=UPI003EC0180D
MAGEAVGQARSTTDHRLGELSKAATRIGDALPANGSRRLIQIPPSTAGAT